MEMDFGQRQRDKPRKIGYRKACDLILVITPFDPRCLVKQIIAVVKPYLAERVLESLRRAPLEALSVAEVKGFGRQKSYLDEYAKTEYAEAFLPKVEITMWVDDTRVEEILQKVVAVARSGRMGDGKIFVVPVVTFC